MIVATRSKPEDFGVESNFGLILLCVTLLHLLLILAPQWSWLKDEKKKTQDMTIELSGSMPTGGGGAHEPLVGETKPMPPRPKETPKPEKTAAQPKIKRSSDNEVSREKRPSESVERPPKFARSVKESTVARESAGSSAPEGVAAAPTTDANYKAAHLHNPKPPYPPLAFQLKVEGTVLLRARVMADGVCAEVHIDKSSGNRLLDDSALSTVKAWHFIPAQQRGVAQEQWLKIPISFEIKPQQIPAGG